MCGVEGLSRREFATRLAQSCLGVSALPVAFAAGPGRGFAAGVEGAAESRVPTARNVIYLYMAGGMSHLDTLNAAAMGVDGGVTSFQKTSADGVLLSEHLPLLARQMHHAVIINSLNSTQGAHLQGNYFMHTSYTMRSTIKHPSLGAWMSKFQGRSHPTLPPSVVITNDSRHPGAGFFEAAQAPLVINNPEAGLADVRTPGHLAASRLDRRLDLAGKLDGKFRSQYEYQTIAAMQDLYADAIKMMRSEDLVAFDIDQESAAVRERYGSHAFGQGCLLARRLVEHGVRFVEVSLGGWDHHVDLMTRLPENCAILDQALASLLEDLNARGLLEETLVVLTTEFGRTPKINQNDGRDHYPKAFSSLLAGGGVRGGQVYGKTDAGGQEVVKQKMDAPDLNATIAYALGLPFETVLFSPSKRPFTLADKGQPVRALFG